MTSGATLAACPVSPRIGAELPSVACLLSSPLGAELGSSVRGRASVRLFDDRLGLLAHVRADGVAAVVVDLRDASGRPTTGTVRTLRSAAPRLPLFARCRLAEHDCRALLGFARAGGTDVLVDGTGYGALRTVLAAPGVDGPSVGALIDRLLAAGVPPAFEPLLDFLFRHVDDPAASSRAADTLGVGRRALERRLARAQLPSPRVLHGWCRLLVAAERLGGDTVAVERIAHDVGFSSGNALRNALQRYGGTTPTALRADDGLGTLLARLRARGGAGSAEPDAASYDLIGAGTTRLVRETVAAWLVHAVRAR